MARNTISIYIEKPKVKRKGVHSKNASRGQVKFKKTRIGQGKRRQPLTKNLKNFKLLSIDFLINS